MPLLSGVDFCFLSQNKQTSCQLAEEAGKKPEMYRYDTETDHFVTEDARFCHTAAGERLAKSVRHGILFGCQETKGIR